MVLPVSQFTEETMRRMTIPAIALAISLVPGALAGQTPTQMPRGGAGLERILEQREELGLSEQQVTELRRIQAELRQKNEPLLQQLRAARQEMTPEQRQQMSERRQQVRERMQNMTPEQRQQMRERMQNMTPEQRQQMREQRQNARPGQGQQARQRMQNMTPEQRQQMRERMQNMTPEQRQQMRERMQNERPGPAIRGGVPEELQPALEQVRANTRAAAERVHATLTQEQRQKLVELRAARRAPRGGR